MKVLHVCTFPTGGAGIASRRIHEALRRAGADSRMCFRDSPDGIIPPFRRYFLNPPMRCLRKTIDLFRKTACRSPNPASRSESLFPFADVEKLNASDADIVHLHWICGDFLSIGSLAEIRKPLVWTLHDNWVYCGSEFCVDTLHGDRRFLEGYRADNFPEGASGPDLDRLIWLYKKRCWKNLRAEFVAPSRWNAEQFTRSALFCGTPCEVIRNPLDLTVFYPRGGSRIRERFGIEPSRRILLFGAEIVDNPIKGMKLLKQSFQFLVKKIPSGELHLICFGQGDAEFFRKDVPFPCSFAGVVREEAEMAELYSAADGFVCPSVVDNYPNTCAESLACGTPVAAFRTAGLPELAIPGETGTLAEPFEPESLAGAILTVLRDKPTLSPRARQYAEQNNSPEKAAEAYLHVYERALG